MFYSFRQNNSGGSFKGPAITVWVEADSPEEANNIFTTLDDCYFDPEYKQDCECCLTRWHETLDFEGKSHYEMLRYIDNENNNSWKDVGDLIGRNKIPQHMIRHKDGTIQYI
jgi:hypothetical protein